MVQWLGIHLPMQWIWVPSLAQEDCTCRGATKPMPMSPEPVPCSKKPEQQDEEQPPLTTTRESPCAETKTPPCSKKYVKDLCRATPQRGEFFNSLSWDGDAEGPGTIL